MNVYNGRFTCFDDVISDFCMTTADLEGVEILFADYEACGYEGEAWVIFRKDGKLYDVEASHCSCNDLGYQWNPVLTSVKALLKYSRVENNEELKALITKLEE